MVVLLSHIPLAASAAAGVDLYDSLPTLEYAALPRPKPAALGEDFT
jgi:hypothetical protein